MQRKGSAMLLLEWLDKSNLTLHSKKMLVKLVKKHEAKINNLPEPFKEAFAIAFISKSKARDLSPHDVAVMQQQAPHTSEAETIAQVIYEDYEEALKKSNSLDFDDLLCYGVKLFQQKPNLAHWCKHILVDEL